MRVAGSRSCAESSRPAPCRRHFPMISASSRSVFLFLIVALVNCLVMMGLMSLKGISRARQARARCRWYSAVASEPIVMFFFDSVSRNLLMVSGVLTTVYRSATRPSRLMRAPTNSSFETSKAMIVMLKVSELLREPREKKREEKRGGAFSASAHTSFGILLSRHRLVGYAGQQCSPTSNTWLN